MTSPASAVWCEHAFVNGATESGVLIEFTGACFSSVTPDCAPGSATRLHGFTVPAMANAHSHTFQRSLRSRAQGDTGTFWTWRELMYRAADRLEPDSYHRLARAVFGEMALAGISCVGEFHYLHHQRGGTPYDDPNEMGLALLAAADAAGIRITLLDTLYLHGGLDRDGYQPPNDRQRRFCDGTVERWADRVDRLQSGDRHRIGAAIHSIRAVAPDDMRAAANWAATRAAPTHAHLSEQPLENQSCLAFHGASPIAVAADAGLLTENFTAVHATHPIAGDIAMLAAAGSTVAMCPTTERDLGDGIGPTNEFAAADISMALGSDSHAVIDLFEEARALELDERLRSQRRGVHSAGALMAMATVNGHRSLGWHDAGSIAVGNRADLVTIDLNSVRTAGYARDTLPETALFAATAADVSSVYVDGHRIVAEHAHTTIDVANELTKTITELMVS